MTTTPPAVCPFCKAKQHEYDDGTLSEFFYECGTDNTPNHKQSTQCVVNCYRQQISTLTAELARMVCSQSADVARLERELAEATGSLSMASKAREYYKQRAEAAESALTAASALAKAVEEERDACDSHFLGDIGILTERVDAALAHFNEVSRG